MISDIDDIVKSLNTIADNIYNEPDVGPHLEMIYVTNVGNTRFTIKCLWHPFYIRHRAKKLNRSIINSKLLLQPSKTRKPSLRQARFNKEVAQQFLDDGETNNYNNYMGLFK